MEQNITEQIGAKDGKIELPSGAIATVAKFTGEHVLEVINRSLNKGAEKSAIKEEDLTFNLIALTAKVDGKAITCEDILDMDGGDVMFLMAEFAKSVNYEPDEAALPDNPPAGSYYKRLPNNQLACIKKFKGIHIQEAQRQMKRDGSDYFPVLISRLVEIDGQCIFPEDISAMDGLNVFALFGEVSAAMFPKK
jgi:hypothetical protein